MSNKAVKDHYLDDLLCDKRMELSLLQAITNNFSEDMEIGTGGYGVVYKGTLRDGFVAVKKFKSVINDEAFRGEVDCLTRIKHPNIVRYIGYCAEAYKQFVIIDNKYVFAESRQQLICFEYLPNGSLGSHLTAQPCTLEWHMCYKIIQGICLGLDHLHVHNIIHRDIKPDNILLDDNMTPKIADFGLSTILGDGESRKITENKCGTLGYMAPESIVNGIFNFKSDIYSLGVLITEIVTGHKPALMNEPVRTCFFFDLERGTVFECCRRLKLDASERQTELEQVKACIEISISCTQHEAHNRPVMPDILRRLGITETSDWAALGGINAPSLPPSATGTGPKVQPETSLQASAKGPGDTNPEKSTRWLETTTASANSKMLSSRSLQIANNKRWHWKWDSIQGSRFSECAELMGVHDLAVTGEVSPADLSAGKSYTVYLVYKLASSTSGLKGFVQTSSLRLYGEHIVATNKVSLDPEARGSAGDVTYPDARDDGWLELKLAEFTNDDDMLTEKGVIVDLRENNLTVKKSGLIVEVMEFRSN